ncbi:hypothetical protein CHS0354_022923, partial [Potamilus streckersoni]
MNLQKSLCQIPVEQISAVVQSTVDLEDREVTYTPPGIGNSEEMSTRVVQVPDDV